MKGPKSEYNLIKVKDSFYETPDWLIQSEDVIGLYVIGLLEKKSIQRKLRQCMLLCV